MGMLILTTEQLMDASKHEKWTHKYVGVYDPVRVDDDHDYGYLPFDIKTISICQTRPIKIIFKSPFLTNFSTVKKDDSLGASIHFFDSDYFIDVRETKKLSLKLFTHRLNKKFKKNDLNGVVFTFEPELDKYDIIIN